MDGTGGDPLLQGFDLGPVRLKNRIFSSGHALSHAQGGQPTDTTLRYQMEKAKGGIGLSFVGGSGTVSADTAPVFDQLIINHEIIPFFFRAGRVLSPAWSGADDADHASWPPHECQCR